MAAAATQACAHAIVTSTALVAVLTATEVSVTVSVRATQPPELASALLRGQQAFGREHRARYARRGTGVEPVTSNVNAMPTAAAINSRATACASHLVKRGTGLDHPAVLARRDTREPTAIRPREARPTKLESFSASKSQQQRVS
jgi:hypothetical protein